MQRGAGGTGESRVKPQIHNLQSLNPAQKPQKRGKQKEELKERLGRKSGPVYKPGIICGWSIVGSEWKVSMRINREVDAMCAML
jgi:hypothetical protein